MEPEESRIRFSVVLGFILWVIIYAREAFGSLGVHKDNGYNPHEYQRSTTDILDNILGQITRIISNKTLRKM